MSPMPWLVMLLTTLAVPAGAGAIRGVVGIHPRPGDVGAPLADAVVLIDGPTVPASADAPHAVMDQFDHAFRPHVLAIGVGTTVDFPNHDPVLHDVNSASPAKVFDLGLYDRGQTRSVTFDTPGLIRVRCNVHPVMGGLIVVHDNPNAAVTDAEGRYTMENVPPGTHPLRVWHDDFVPREVVVTVPREGLTQLDIQLERAR